MQNERGNRDLRDPFGMFAGFGNFGGFGGSIFGRNPFDDPFFTRPFGSLFDQGATHSLPVIPPNEPVIEELIADDEENDVREELERGDESEKGAMPNNEPLIDHPDDETDDNLEHENHRTDYAKDKGSQAQTFKVHSSKVSYGGIDGVYYSSSAIRRMGRDGVIMEECKEADKTTGEATHRISRGLHDKGHSLTRKLNSDGRVDTLHKLHNLNEDEFGSFEEAWKDNTGTHQSPWTGSRGSQSDEMSEWGALLLPSSRHLGDSKGREDVNQNMSNSSGGRTRKVVRIPID